MCLWRRWAHCNRHGLGHRQQTEVARHLRITFKKEFDRCRGGCLPDVPSPRSFASSALFAAASPTFPSSSKVPDSILGFLRWDFGPKVSPNGSVSTICERYTYHQFSVYFGGLIVLRTLRVFGLRASSSKAIGSLFRFKSTE